MNLSGNFLELLNSDKYFHRYKSKTLHLKKYIFIYRFYFDDRIWIIEYSTNNVLHNPSQDTEIETQFQMLYYIQRYLSMITEKEAL